MSDFILECPNPEGPSPTLIGEVVHLSSLRPGRHIFTYRRFGLLVYSHHGIYEGDGMVIHLTRTRPSRSDRLLLPSCSPSRSEKLPPCKKCGPPDGGESVLSGGVVRICLDCFCRDGPIVRPLRVYSYGLRWRQLLLSVPGTGTVAPPARSLDQVLETARAFLLAGDFGRYNLLRNNCEHFATLCVTGERISKQADLWGYVAAKLDHFSRLW